jgi:hypothetical protein
MTAPARIQRLRAAGWRKPEGAVYVGRPTRYGNPYQLTRVGSVWVVYVQVENSDRPRTISTGFDERAARQEAVDLFRDMFRTPGGAEQGEHFARQLQGRDLMCWCAPDMPCHADVLLDLCNATTGDPR